MVGYGFFVRHNILFVIQSLMNSRLRNKSISQVDYMNSCKYNNCNQMIEVSRIYLLWRNT